MSSASKKPNNLSPFPVASQAEGREGMSRAATVSGKKGEQRSMETQPPPPPLATSAPATPLPLVVTSISTAKVMSKVQKQKEKLEKELEQWKLSTGADGDGFTTTELVTGGSATRSLCRRLDVEDEGDKVSSTASTLFVLFFVL